MKNTLTETDGDKTVFKIVALLSVLFILGALALYGVTALENAKKADAYFAKAQDACEQDHLESCLSQVNQALQLGEKTDYYRLKFNVLSSQDKTHESKEVLDKLISLEPGNAHYYFLRSRLARTTGDESVIFENIEKAIRMQPNNGEYQIAKATMLVERDRAREAVPIYEKLIAGQPQYYYYWDQYALSYSNYGNWAPALQLRLKGMRLNPKDYMQFFGLAQLYDRMGKVPESVAAYRHSLELHPMENSIAARRILEMTGKRVPPALENATTDTLPIETRNRLTFVTADINGNKGRFLLDTGASISVVFKSKAPQYRLAPLDQVITAETANGFAQAPLAYGHLRLGRQDIDNARFAVLKDLSNASVDGIIGMDILGLFRFEIDRNQGLLTLRSQ